MSKNFKRTGCALMSVLLAQNLFSNVSAMKEPEPNPRIFKYNGIAKNE